MGVDFRNPPFVMNLNSMKKTCLQNLSIKPLGGRFSYSRAFGDGLRNIKPWSSDEDDTCAGASPPNFHTTPMGERLSLCTAGHQRYWARTHYTPQLRVRYLDH
ncbi:hypothetical protein TNCV_498811 [Trichonephila clavipes]|nr:hypothetical protein TNCV_498811 [Trichonephila clavipes]